MTRVASTEVNPASCILSIFLGKMGKVQACYTAKFKLEVVRYAQERGNKSCREKI
jgi:hypothetical protein